MSTERTASRRIAVSICLGLGLAATVVALIWMVVDQATGDSVASHVHELYTPYGDVPDPIVPWVFLYSVFGLAIVGWAVALIGTWRGAKWARWWSTACFVVGSALLIFGAVVSEHEVPILPLSWRIVSIALAAFGALTVVVAWLPTTERIKK